MFEVIVSLCLMAQPASCRDVLLAGYEAKTPEACEARLKTLPDLWKVSFSAYAQPDGAKCVEAGEAAAFEEVGEGVFAHRGIISDAAPENFGDVSNIGFVIGDNSVAVIDSGGSRKVGEQIYRAIRKRSDLPISHLILTHMHPDHVLGASVFAEIGANVVGHAGLERALQDRSASYLGNFRGLIGAAQFIGTRIVVPDIAVESHLEIDLGSRVLETRTWPRSHTSTDLTVLDTKADILFTGDLVFHEHAPALDGSLSGWQSVLEDMAELNVKRIVPGHGGPILPWPASSQALTDYLDVLEADTRAAITAGISLGEAVKVIAAKQASNWQLFDLFNPRNATVAYTELEWE